MSTFHLPDASQAAWCRDSAASLATDSLRDKLADCFLNSRPTPTAGSDFNETRVALAEWIDDGMAAARERRIMPIAVDREVSLAEAVAAFNAPALPGEWRHVPVSTIGNDPDPGLLTPAQNLQFRFLHDWLHAVVGADASFEGELALTFAHQVSSPLILWSVFASEVAGQAAVAIRDGAFPEQKLAGACWNVLWMEASRHWLAVEA